MHTAAIKMKRTWRTADRTKKPYQRSRGSGFGETFKNPKATEQKQSILQTTCKIGGSLRKADIENFHGVQLVTLVESFRVYSLVSVECTIRGLSYVGFQKRVELGRCYRTGRVRCHMSCYAVQSEPFGSRCFRLFLWLADDLAV